MKTWCKFAGLLLMLPLLFLSCSRQDATAESAALHLFQSLARLDFSAASELATDDSAPILLAMEMVVKNHQGSVPENIPVPAERDKIGIITHEATAVGTPLTVTFGRKSVEVIGVETTDGWRIRIPRSSWTVD